MQSPFPGLDAGREALRRFLVGEDDHDAMLRTICQLAVETVPGANAASITLALRGQATTVTSTSTVATRLDEVQYEIGDGPCLSALRHQGLERVVTGDGRWPPFELEAEANGIQVTMSAPLVADDEVRGALNLYATTAFDDGADEVARRFADQLGVAAAKAAVYVDRAALADQLQEALESRAVIEQAKGILMASERCDAERAFDILRQASQHQNRKLRVVAQEVVARYSGRPRSV